MGKLGDVLKQKISGYRDSGIDTKFDPSFVQYNGISNTSPVIDLGVLKTGLKDIRAAYKKADPVPGVGFAVYLNQQPVMFVITDSYKLAGSSREQWMAWDLTPWQDIINAIDKDLPYHQRLRTISTSIRTKIDYDWTSDGGQVEKLINLVGERCDTATISGLMNRIMEISQRESLPVTAKLVLRDQQAAAKRLNRVTTRQEIQAGIKELKDRLLAYKLSKQPTANTIHEFIEWCQKNRANIVTFAGVNYRMIPTDSYTKPTPLEIMQGKTFKIQYDAVSGSEYSGHVVYLTYRYNSSTNQMDIVSAEWTDRSDGKYRTQTAIISPAVWFKVNRAICPALAKLVQEIEKDPARKSDVLVHREIMKTIMPLLTSKNPMEYKKALMLLDAIQLMGITFPDLESALEIAQNKLDSD